MEVTMFDVICPKCKHKFNAKQDCLSLEEHGKIVDAQFEEAWNNQVASDY